jgi:hypothetical protein
MSTRHLGAVSLKRFLAAERYRKSHPASPVRSLPKLDPVAAGGHAQQAPQLPQPEESIDN